MLASSDKDRLLFIPGPTPVTREILDALAEPTISHTSGEFAGIMTRTLEELGQLMDNRGGAVFAFAGPGRWRRRRRSPTSSSRAKHCWWLQTGTLATEWPTLPARMGSPWSLFKRGGGARCGPPKLKSAFRRARLARWHLPRGDVNWGP